MFGADESLKLTSKLYNRVCRHRRRSAGALRTGETLAGALEDGET